MAEQNQPITRKEFEAGVKFYHSLKLDPIDKYSSYKRDPLSCIVDKFDKYHCNIQRIDEDGFHGMLAVFGRIYEFKVFFKNCYKVPNQ